MLGWRNAILKSPVWGSLLRWGAFLLIVGLMSLWFVLPPPVRAIPLPDDWRPEGVEWDATWRALGTNDGIDGYSQIIRIDPDTGTLWIMESHWDPKGVGSTHFWRQELDGTSSARSVEVPGYAQQIPGAPVGILRCGQGQWAPPAQGTFEWFDFDWETLELRATHRIVPPPPVGKYAKSMMLELAVPLGADDYRLLWRPDGYGQGDISLFFQDFDLATGVQAPLREIPSPPDSNWRLSEPGSESMFYAQSWLPNPESNQHTRDAELNPITLEVRPLDPPVAIRSYDEWSQLTVPPRRFAPPKNADQFVGILGIEIERAVPQAFRPDLLPQESWAQQTLAWAFTLRYNYWRWRYGDIALMDAETSCGQPIGVALRSQDGTTDRLLAGDFLATVRQEEPGVGLPGELRFQAQHNWNQSTPVDPPGEPHGPLLERKVTRVTERLGAIQIEGDRWLVWQVIARTPSAMTVPEGLLRVGTLEEDADQVDWIGWIRLPETLNPTNPAWASLAWDPANLYIHLLTATGEESGSADWLLTIQRPPDLALPPLNELFRL